MFTGVSANFGKSNIPVPKKKNAISFKGLSQQRAIRYVENGVKDCFIRRDGRINATFIDDFVNPKIRAGNRMVTHGSLCEKVY